MTPAEEAQVVVALEVMAKDEAEIDRQRLVIAALVQSLLAVLPWADAWRNAGERLFGPMPGMVADIEAARAALKLAADSGARKAATK